MRLSILFWAFVWLLLIAPLQVAAAPAVFENAVVIALDDYPPYHYWVDEVPAGLNVVLINAAFDRLGLKPTYVRMPWKRSLDAVEHGDVTALCAGMKTPAREKFAFYPARYLSLETNWIITLADSGIRLSSLDDLAEYSIGTVSSYSYGPVFDSLRDLDKHERRNESLLLDLLINKRVDCIVGCDLVVEHIARERGESDRLKYQIKLSSDPLYLIFSKAIEGNKRLSERVSATLVEMVEDGTYDRVLRQYLTE